MIVRQYYSCNEMRREGLTVFDPPSSIELILPMTFEDLGFKPVTLLMRICQNAPSDYAVPFRRAHGTTCIHTGDFLFVNLLAGCGDDDETALMINAAAYTAADYHFIGP